MKAMRDHDPELFALGVRIGGIKINTELDQLRNYLFALVGEPGGIEINSDASY
jgi:hypothetical protein